MYLGLCRFWISIAVFACGKTERNFSIVGVFIHSNNNIVCMDELFTQGLFALFFVISIGLILGRVKIRGFSLDVSGVIFIAMLLGYWGIEIPKMFQNFGILLFIFTIGIQSGPGFFNSFISNGKKPILLTLILIGSGVLATVVLCYVFGFGNIGSILGVFNGGMASSIGLAASIDVVSSAETSLNYSLVYPFAVIITILFFQLIPSIVKVDFSKENAIEAEDSRRRNPAIMRKDYKIENPNIENKTIRDLNFRATTGATISRIKHLGEVVNPTLNTILSLGDTIRVIGTDESHQKAELLLGKSVDNENMELQAQYENIWLLVTNKRVVGKTLEEINLSGIFNSNVIRLQRGNSELEISGKLKIRYGDRLQIATDISHAEAVTEFLGNNIKQAADTDFLPITLGIIIGIFIGSLTIPIHNSLQIKLGLSGGVLISSLILSYIGKTGPIIWAMSNVSNNLFRQLGLLIFLAAVGTDAGAHLTDVFNRQSIVIVAIGCLVAVLPMIIGYVVGRYFFKISFIPLMGIMSGALNSTLGLTIIGVKTESENLQTNYTTTYPFALVLMIILPQILSIIIK